MADILFPFNGTNLHDKKTFVVGGSDEITFGQAVRISALNNGAAGTENQILLEHGGTGNYIGWAMPDDKWEAGTGREVYGVGDLIPVALRGAVVRAKAGTGIGLGELLYHDNLGQITNRVNRGTGDYQGTSRPLQVVGISLQNAGSGAKVNFVRFS